MRRRLLAVAIVAASLLGLLAIGAFPQDPVRRLLERRLGAALGGSVTIGRLRVVPARLSLDAHDLRFDAPGRRGRVDRVQVRSRWGTFSSESLSLDLLELQGLEVEARAPVAPPAAPSPALPRVDIERLVVRDAAVRYVDPNRGAISLTSLEAEGGIGDGALRVTAGVLVSAPDTQPVTARLRASLQVGGDLDTTLVEAHLATESSTLLASGRLGILTAAQPDLRFDADVDVAEAARIAGRGVAAGRLRATGRLKAADGLDWEAEFASASLEANGFAVSSLRGDAASRNSKLRCRFAFSTLGGHAKVDATFDNGRLDARLEAKDLQAADLARLAGERRDVTGQLCATLTLRGPAAQPAALLVVDGPALALRGMPLSLRAQARGSVALEKREPRLTWTLQGDARPQIELGAAARMVGARFEAAGTASGTGSPLVVGQAAAHVEIAVGDGVPRDVPLALEYRGRGDSVEVLAVRIPDTELAGLVPEGQGFARFDLRAHGPVARLSGSARFEGRDAQWRGIRLGSIQLDATSRSGGWTLEARVPEHAVGLDAVSPFPGPGPRRLSGSLVFDASGLAPLAPWLPASLPRDARVSGQLGFEGRLDAAGLAWRSDLRLEGTGYSAHVEGTLGAPPESLLDLRVIAQADAATLDQSEAIDVAGSLTADARLGGTRTAPTATGEVKVSGLKLAGKGLPAVDLEEALVVLDGSSAELRPAVFQVAGGRVTASGRHSIAGNVPSQLHLEWDGLAAEALRGALAPDRQAETPLVALVSGSADLSGTGAELLGWQGVARVEVTQAKAGDLPLDLTPVVLRLDRGILDAAPLTLRSGPGSLTLQGRLDLAARSVAASAQGAVDLRALSPLVGSASLTGVAELDMSVDGTLDAPQPHGALVFKDASVRPRDIPEALTDIEAKLAFDGAQVRLENARATLGGGDVTASGQAILRGASLTSMHVEVRGREMALRYPVGLRSRIEADLVLASSGNGFLLRGDVKALRGLYDLDLALEQSVRTPEQVPETSPLLRSIALDIRVSLDSPVLVRNKLASVDVDGSLQFRGDLEKPAPFGRLDIQDGGKIYLANRAFAVEAGRLAYSGDWDPVVNLRASRLVRDVTDLREYDVELLADGQLSTVQPVLRAEGLTDGEALSLVATGDKSDSGSAIGARVAGQQAANLALGELTQGLGLDEVTVQPELLARETDPGTRFTFGKQLTPILSLIYSLSLRGPEQRFTQVELRLPHQVSLKGQRTDDGVLAVGAGQRFRFGGGGKRAASSEAQVRLLGVRFEGDVPPEVRGAVKARAGKRVAAWDIQEDADRLRRRLVERGHIEALVGGRIEGEVATFRVQPGPRFDWRITGVTPLPDLREAFGEALYEEDAVDRARIRILETLRKRGHLRARLSGVAVEEAVGRRTLVFQVEAGPVLQAMVDFPGAHVLSHKQLLKAAGGPGPLLTEPSEALRHIEQAYARAGRFAARLGPVEARDEGAVVRVRVPVAEGAAPRLAVIAFTGASLPEDELREAAGLRVGGPYSTETVAAATEKLRNHYYALGHAQAGVVVDNVLQGSDIEVRFRIREGERSVVGSVEIVGLKRTRESMVRRQVRLKPGDPIDPRRLASTERRLLDLGVFSQVFVTAGSGSPSTVRIELVEKERVQTAYDLRWSEEASTSVQLDSEIRNLLGLGLNLGGRYRVGGDDREKRASILAPSMRRGKFTVAAYEVQEDFEATDIFTGEVFTNTQTERVIEFQQTLPVKRRTNVLIGYRFKTVYSIAFPIPTHVAGVDLSGIREARDNPLDARRGHFAGVNLQLSPKVVGSDLTFVKGFGQFFLHRGVTRSWTWSQGFRLGLAHGFGGQTVISSERFEAGGADSLRGFPQDSVGPRNFLGEPTGGEAVLILNQELRYRHPSGLGLALFWDAGNVFERVKDLGLDLRHDLGAGARWVSPIGLLRLDLAFPLSREANEDPYRLVFSLGQAF